MKISTQELNEDELDALIEKLAHSTHEHRLNAPVIFFLELHKPLCGLLHSASVFLEPLASPLFGGERILSLQQLLADRKNIEKLIVRIEALELRTS